MVKDQITNVIPNEYILEYSAAVALMYMYTKNFPLVQNKFYSLH